MNKEKTNLILALGIMGVVTAICVIAVVSIVLMDSTETEEFEFLKAFAYDNTSDPDWQCKKTLGLYELAKQYYPHFIENTKWLADKHCGFDVSIITP